MCLQLEKHTIPTQLQMLESKSCAGEHLPWSLIMDQHGCIQLHKFLLFWAQIIWHPSCCWSMPLHYRLMHCVLVLTWIWWCIVGRWSFMSLCNRKWVMDKQKFKFNYLFLLKQVDKTVSITLQKNTRTKWGKKERISEISTWKVCYIQNSEESELKD